MSYETIALLVFFALVYLNAGYIIGAKMWDVYDNYEDYPIIAQKILWPVTEIPSNSPVKKCTRSEYALLMSIFWLLHFVWQWFWALVGGIGFMAYVIFRTIFQILTWPASWVAK